MKTLTFLEQKVMLESFLSEFVIVPRVQSSY